MLPLRNTHARLRFCKHSSCPIHEPFPWLHSTRKRVLIDNLDVYVFRQNCTCNCAHALTMLLRLVMRRLWSTRQAQRSETYGKLIALLLMSCLWSLLLVVHGQYSSVVQAIMETRMTVTNLTGQPVDSSPLTEFDQAVTNRRAIKRNRIN